MPDRMCPKCGFAQPDTNEVCGQCGVVFEKYHQQRDALLKKTSARTGPPPPTLRKRVRPLTYFMLLLLLGLGAYKLQKLEMVQNPPDSLSGDEGISRGGNIDVKKRGRVETTAPVDEHEWEGEIRYGIKVFPDATLITETEVENPDDPAQHISRFETNAPFDTVLEFYTAEFGWTRAMEEAVHPPAGIAVGASQQGVTGKRARWYALASDGEGNSLKIDVTIQSPFFDPDGTFHPETTLIALSHLR